MKKLCNLIDGIQKGTKSIRIHPEYYGIQLKWEALFGDLAKELAFGYIKETSLVIYSVNPAWVNEILYYEKEFLEKINNVLTQKKLYLKKIIVKVQRQQAQQKKEKKTKKKATTKSLEMNIKNTTKQRITLGYKPCEKCAIVLTLNKMCIFCQTKCNV